MAALQVFKVLVKRLHLTPDVVGAFVNYLAGELYVVLLQYAVYLTAE